MFFMNKRSKIFISGCEYKYSRLMLFSFVTLNLKFVRYYLFFSLFLFDAPINLLLDPDQTYRVNFVNSIVVKVFDDIMDLIKVKTYVGLNLSLKKIFHLLYTSGHQQVIFCTEGR